MTIKKKTSATIELDPHEWETFQTILVMAEIKTRDPNHLSAQDRTEVRAMLEKLMLED